MPAFDSCTVVPNRSADDAARASTTSTQSGCTVCGNVTDAEVDEKQVMKLVKNQKGHVQDCAVVLIGVCEVCCEKQAQENAH